MKSYDLESDTNINFVFVLFCFSEASTDTWVYFDHFGDTVT